MSDVPEENCGYCGCKYPESEMENIPCGDGAVTPICKTCESEWEKVYQEQFGEGA
jgi:hypothetical protein